MIKSVRDDVKAELRAEIQAECTQRTQLERRVDEQTDSLQTDLGEQQQKMAIERLFSDELTEPEYAPFDRDAARALLSRALSQASHPDLNVSGTRLARTSRYSPHLLT